MRPLTFLLLFSFIPMGNFAISAESIAIGDRRELLVDHELIDSLENVQLVMHPPRDEGPVLKFERPWEGRFSGYATVIRDGDLFRLYYRGNPEAGKDGDKDEVYCYAESTDGITWMKPDLGLYEIDGTRENNVVLANVAPITHNFSPMLDTRAGVPADQRFKALGGTMESGLVALVSADGKSWKKLREEAVIPGSMVPFPYYFDSQNVCFWSEAEQKYVSFFRVFENKIRRICRITSDDFLTWSEPVLMEYQHEGGDAPIEHLYTNQTHPYFRAPHLYLSIAARFMPGRQVLTDDQAKAIDVNPGYFKDTSDAILMTARPGRGHYERTFLSSFVRPGIGARNWVSRTNYPALNVVQTGPTEMSVYLNQDYAQTTAHLHRYSMRLDGFSSAQGAYEGGELITKPLTFSGKELALNFSTSAAGGIRVEIQDVEGKAIPGFSLAEAREQIGNEIERVVSWKGGSDVSSLAGKAVRLRFELKDADLFAFKFSK
ncbi:MAG: hypothetical protein KDN20_02855 [Verrucomicrobiae bacterium]|nr:hypothetical protein [Verrucomicrobiae bacterium]